MPMSQPTGEVPASFNPTKNCGATIKVDKADPNSPTTVCMNAAGKINGRCKWHGGSLQARAGGQAVRETLLARASAIRNSDQLLTLDNEIAVVKAIIEQKFRMYDDLYSVANVLIDRIQSGDPSLDGEFPAITPEDIDSMIDLKELDTLNRLIKTAYDMRFSKRFSVPITELESIMNQVAESFRDTVQRFGIPNEAVVYFANKIANLKLSRPVDYQLDRAGGLPSPTIVFDQISGGEGEVA